MLSVPRAVLSVPRALPSSVPHCAVRAPRARARRWGNKKRGDKRFGWMHTAVKLLEAAQAMLPEHSVEHHGLSLVM